jgi:hypothetical protein
VFVPLALLAIVIAAVGFWPGYFGPVLAGTGAKTLVGGPPPSVTLGLLIWTLPVLLAMAHDFVTKRLVHPVYVLGLAVMIAMRLVSPRSFQPWLDFTAWLAAFYS